MNSGSPVSQMLRFKSTCHEETQVIGKKIAELITFPSCIYLDAEMGMGKTTLCKSIIAGLSCQQTVTSPTYNLIQEYSIEEGVVYHMDLYRLDDPSELEFLALPDLWNSESVFLIEWPQKGEGFLQFPTHKIGITKLEGTQKREITFESMVVN